MPTATPSRRKTPPHPVASPHPQTFPPFPAPTARPEQLPLFMSCPTVLFPAEKHRPARQDLPAPPNFPALPTTYYPTRLPPSFYSRPTSLLPSRAVPPLSVGLPAPPKTFLPFPPSTAQPGYSPLFLCPVQLSPLLFIYPPDVPKVWRRKEKPPSTPADNIVRTRTVLPLRHPAAHPLSKT